MPQFTTISPTNIPGKKEYAWTNFLKGSYVAIGWLSHFDLTGKSIDQVIELIKSRKYDNESSAIDAFTKFLSLKVGDYVAVNNTNDGLFGVGVIKSDYKYEKNKHDTGSEDKEDFYSHYRVVDWKYTGYVKRKNIISQDETGWKPFGTIGSLEKEVPPYIQRLLGAKLPKQKKPHYVKPQYLERLIKNIETLRSDTEHKEKDHESLVEELFVALGYEKLKDIRFQRQRIDISVWYENKIVIAIEVKPSWNLDIYKNTDDVEQAYMYAVDQGVRYVILTNGDYYAVYDRLKGLSASSNIIGVFQLSALNEENLKLIEQLRKEKITKPNIEQIFQYLSECFKTE